MDRLAKLREAFELAAKWVKEHHRESNVSNSTLFRLYGLYKRGMFGACNVRQPALVIEPVARERYNAWKAASVLTETQAMRTYVDIVRDTFPQFVKKHEELLKELEVDVELMREENLALMQMANDMIKQFDRFKRKSISKRGYLYKWRSEPLGFGLGKWKRKYVVLEGTRLSVYDRMKSAAPAKFISLRNCVVSKEPSKKRGEFFVFSVQPATPGEFEGPDIEEDGTVIRFSTEAASDMDEWVAALVQACVAASHGEPSSPADLLPAMSSGATRSDSQVRALATAALAVTRLARKRSGGKVQEHEEEEEEEEEEEGAEETITDVGKKGTASPSKLRRQMSRRLVQRAELERAAAEAANKPSTEEAVKAPRPKIDPKMYPGGMNMHTKSRPSVLASEATDTEYRGYFNLGLIVLGVYFAHAFLDIAGMLASIPITLPTVAASFHEILLAGASLAGYITAAFLIELAAYHGVLPNFLIALLYMSVCGASLILPTWTAWAHPEAPGATAILLFGASVVFLKLVSYAHANWDYRTSWQQRQSHDDNAKPPITDGTSYPAALTFKHLLYYFFAPTLVYQLSYPRTSHVRWKKVLTLVLQIIIVSAFMGWIIDQQIKPIVDSAMADLSSNRLYPVAYTLLRMAVPSTAVWLTMFYCYFHLTLNLFAELLRFGDRLFYKDWWNCTSFSRYWRTWNIPVHNWLLRHVHFPLMRLGCHKLVASVVVFTISAIFHEVLISVPCHTVRLWAFSAMMGQIPLIIITDLLEKSFFKDTYSQAGNFMFWIVFCMLGQPMAALLYYYDFQQRHVAVGSA